MTKRIVLAAAFVALLVTVPGRAAGVENPETKAVNAAFDRYVLGWQKGDIEMLSKSYSHDARMTAYWPDPVHPLRIESWDTLRKYLVEVFDLIKGMDLDFDRREIDVYRDVLSRVQLDTPAFYGAVIDQRRDSERYWLFLEHVKGIPLWQCELDMWPAAARWLKQLHSHRFENLPASLLRHDAAYYARWIERAAGFRPELQRIAKKYGRAIDRLTALPATFIHGEFYPSNILVEDDRIRPVDWETAAVGPALIDLAALCGGRFDDARREQLAHEYGAAMEDLDFCRLHLAIQWLGWSAQWKPPEEHAHDWLAEAITLARKLGVA